MGHIRSLMFQMSRITTNVAHLRRMTALML